MREQGTRPVVFLTLKEVQSGNYEGLMVKLSEIVSQLYGQSEYLESSDALSRKEREYFTDVFDRTCQGEKLQFALANLMKMMEKHYGKKPILLLDEYDSPILSAWENCYYKEVIDFMLSTIFCYGKGRTDNEETFGLLERDGMQYSP